VGLGGATLSLAQIIVELLRRRLDAELYRDAAQDPLFIGALAGLAVGAFFAIRRSRPLDNLWQQGVIAVLAAFGSLLAGFVAAPVHGVAGLPGMVVWAAACVAFGNAAGRWSLRGAEGKTLAQGTRTR
jgi:hypothetical protein